MPPPGAVVQLIEKAIRPEDSMTNDEYLDLAHKHNTPLGCFIYATVSDYTMRNLPRKIQLDHVAHHRRAIKQFVTDYKAGALSERDMHYLKAKGFDGTQRLLAAGHSPTPTEPLALVGEEGSIDPQVKKLVSGLVKGAVDDQ